MVASVTRSHPAGVLASVERRVSLPRRRAILGAAAVLFTALTFFPRQHTARVKVMPPQSSSAGLGALLSQLGGLSGLAPLLSSRQPVEVYLLLARSHDVALEVVRRADLQRRFDASSPERAARTLERWVDIHSLRGGVIEFEVEGRDAALALRIAEVYAAAFQDRLSVLARDQSSRKRELMTERLRRAAAQVAEAELALTSYRTSHGIASPEAQLGSSVSLLAALRARLQAKEVELATVRRFATDESFDVQRVRSEIAGLRGQIARAEGDTAKQDPFGFQNFARRSSDYLGLYRDLKYSEALYDVYSRYLEAVNMEEASADINAQVVETAYLDPGWSPNAWAAALAAAALALGLVLEVRARTGRAAELA